MQAAWRFARRAGPWRVLAPQVSERSQGQASAPPAEGAGQLQDVAQGEPAAEGAGQLQEVAQGGPPAAGAAVPQEEAQGGPPAEGVQEPDEPQLQEGVQEPEEPQLQEGWQEPGEPLLQDPAQAWPAYTNDDHESGICHVCRQPGAGAHVCCRCRLLCHGDLVGCSRPDPDDELRVLCNECAEGSDLCEDQGDEDLSVGVDSQPPSGLQAEELGEAFRHFRAHQGNPLEELAGMASLGQVGAGIASMAEGKVEAEAAKAALLAEQGEAFRIFSRQPPQARDQLGGCAAASSSSSGWSGPAGRPVAGREGSPRPGSARPMRSATGVEAVTCTFSATIMNEIAPQLRDWQAAVDRAFKEDPLLRKLSLEHAAVQVDAKHYAALLLRHGAVKRKGLETEEQCLVRLEAAYEASYLKVSPEALEVCHGLLHRLHPILGITHRAARSVSKKALVTRLLLVFHADKLALLNLNGMTAETAAVCSQVSTALSQLFDVQKMEEGAGSHAWQREVGAGGMAYFRANMTFTGAGLLCSLGWPVRVRRYCDWVVACVTGHAIASAKASTLRWSSNFFFDDPAPVRARPGSGRLLLPAQPSCSGVVRAAANASCPGTHAYLPRAGPSG